MIAVARRNPDPIRGGFTLLEVLLASVIALMLMAALYSAMDTQLRYAQSGREIVDQSVLARQVLNSIAADLQGCLTPITATPVAASTTATTGASTATGSTAAATGTTGAATTDPAAATDPSTTAGTPAVTASGVTTFSGGLSGDSTMVSVWVLKPPLARGNTDPAAGTVELGHGDVRRITYWFDGGLRKHELKRVTTEDEESQRPPPSGNKIADEVEEVTFSYFDGINWVDTWDGTLLGEDGATPVGPPRAIKVRIGIRHPSMPDSLKYYERTVAIGAANAQPVAAPTTTGGGM